MKLIILIGLPASGKTSWAKEYEKNNPNCKHLELDKCCIIEPKYFSLGDAVVGEINENLNYEVIILDFVFYTFKNIVIALDSCKNFNVDQVELHYWKVDKELCIINDKIRAERENRFNNSSYTIKNRSLEIPKLEYFKDKYKNISFSIYSHNVFNPIKYLNII